MWLRTLHMLRLWLGVQGTPGDQARGVAFRVCKEFWINTIILLKVIYVLREVNEIYTCDSRQTHQC